MKIHILTKKGQSKKNNTDSMLFVCEGNYSNPIIIDNQDFYSHYLEADGSFLAVVSDGMGGDSSALMASKQVVTSYHEHFYKSIDTISEQESMFNISDLFLRAELLIAQEAASNESYIGASAAVAGILYNQALGLFVFNAGDTRVYKKEINASFEVITKDHIYNDNIENFAGGGGGHYVASVGAIRKLPQYHFIASEGFYSNVDITDIEDIIESENSSDIMLEKIKDKLGQAPSNASVIFISYSDIDKK